MSKGSYRQIPMSREQVPGFMVKIDLFLTFDGELRQKYCVCFLTFSAHFYFSENSELTLMMVANRVDNSILERFHVHSRHSLPSYCTQ